MKESKMSIAAQNLEPERDSPSKINANFEEKYAHNNSLTQSIENDPGLRGEENHAIGFQSNSEGGNTVLAEAKAGLADLQVINNQLKQDLLRVNQVHFGNQISFKAHSQTNSPSSKRPSPAQSSHASELQAYIHQLHEMITDILLQHSQERLMYQERIKTLEHSLASTISKYESKLQEYQNPAKLNPLLLKELKAINELNRAFSQTQTSQLSEEELEIMQALKDLERKQPEAVIETSLKENESLSGSGCLSQLTPSHSNSNFHLTLSSCVVSPRSFTFSNGLQTPRLGSQSARSICDENYPIHSEGPTREEINNLSKNLLSKMNVLESVHQKQNDIESKYLLHRKKQELVLHTIKENNSSVGRRKVLGVKDANRCLEKEPLKALVEKENTEPIKKVAEESSEQVHQLEQEIMSLKTKLAAAERRLIAKTFECEDSEKQASFRNSCDNKFCLKIRLKEKEKEINEKKSAYILETKKMALRNRLIDIEVA